MLGFQPPRLGAQLRIPIDLVVYAMDPDAENLDVVYARAIGRGKSAGPDASWGEDFASQVMQAQKDPSAGIDRWNRSDDRLKQVHLLGFLS